MVRVRVSLATIDEKLDQLRDDFEAHASSKFKHFGTVIATTGPVLVAIIELLKYLK